MSHSWPARVGNQSAFSAVPYTLPFDFALGHGFDAFEWFPDRRHPGQGWLAQDVDAAARRAFRDRARDSGVSLSVHAAVHVDPLLPETARDFEEALRLAVDLGAGLINIHFAHPRRADEFARALLPWLERCIAGGVKLALENVPETGPEGFNRLFTALPRTVVQAGHVGMTLDVGHANLHARTANDYIGYLDALGADVPLLHVHLHENWGDRDSHLVVFTGPAGRDTSGIIALLDRLRKRRFAGNIILEQWPEPPEQLVKARGRLLELMTRTGA